MKPNMKQIEVGSLVRFLNQQGGGIVARIQGDKLVVRDEDGMEWPVGVGLEEDHVLD